MDVGSSWGQRLAMRAAVRSCCLSYCCCMVVVPAAVAGRAYQPPGHERRGALLLPVVFCCCVVVTSCCGLKGRTRRPAMRAALRSCCCASVRQLSVPWQQAGQMGSDERGQVQADSVQCRVAAAAWRRRRHRALLCLPHSP